MIGRSSLNTFVVFAALGSALALGGCNSALDGLQGHYEGSLFTKTADKGVRTPVRADVSVGSNGNGLVAVTGVDGKAILDLTISDVGSKSFKLTIPAVASGVRLNEKDGCFLAAGDLAARFCTGDNELVLEITEKDKGQIFTLSVDRFKKVGEVPVEPAQDFTLSSAVEHAFKRNFQNRSEWENVRQARATRNFTRLNMLPGASIGSVVPIAVADYAGIIASVGDLAPFLLPTRWFQMFEAKHKLAAEQDALILLRAATATQVESFTYVIARDQAVYKFYQDTLAQAKALLNQVLAREDLGLLPTGVGDDAMAVVNNIEQSLLAQELALQEDFSALAETMGFYGPGAVRSITIDSTELEPIEAAKTYDRKTIIQTAVDRSFELRQIDSLIKVAHFQKLERFFIWLDPAADYQGKFGFGLGEYIKVGQSQERQLWNTRDSIVADISARLTNALNERVNALKLWRPVKENMAIQNRRLSRILSGGQVGTSADFAGMTQIFQDYLAAEVARESTIAAFRMTRAKIERFLLEGHYEGLAHVPAPDGPDYTLGRKGD